MAAVIQVVAATVASTAECGGGAADPAFSAAVILARRCLMPGSADASPVAAPHKDHRGVAHGVLATIRYSYMTPGSERVQLRVCGRAPSGIVSLGGAAVMARFWIPRAAIERDCLLRPDNSVTPGRDGTIGPGVMFKPLSIEIARFTLVGATG